MEGRFGLKRSCEDRCSLMQQLAAKDSNKREVSHAMRGDVSQKMHARRGLTMSGQRRNRSTIPDLARPRDDDPAPRPVCAVGTERFRSRDVPNCANFGTDQVGQLVDRVAPRFTFEEDAN